MKTHKIRQLIKKDSLNTLWAVVFGEKQNYKSALSLHSRHYYVFLFTQ